MVKSSPYFLDTIVIGDYQMNCYVLGCEKSREVAIVDPGGEPQAIISAVTSRKGVVKMILITHGHYDHLGAVSEIKKTYNCPILIHWAERETLTNPSINLSAFMGENVVCPDADQILDDGDRIKLGELTLEVIHAPGHSTGSICFRCEDFIIGGDVLFRGSIGRTDLPGGSFDELANSIKNRIYTLPDSTIVYSGHGESTTVGFEKKYNPFVRT